MPTPPEGAMISDDKNYWWDAHNQQWMLIHDPSDVSPVEVTVYGGDPHASQSTESPTYTPAEGTGGQCKYAQILVDSRANIVPGEPYAYANDVEGPEAVEWIMRAQHAGEAAVDLANVARAWPMGAKLHSFVTTSARFAGGAANAYMEGAPEEAEAAGWAAAADAEASTVLTAAEAVGCVGAALVDVLLIVVFASSAGGACCSVCPTCFEGDGSSSNQPDYMSVCNRPEGHAEEHFDQNQHTWVGEPHGIAHEYQAMLTPNLANQPY